MLSNSIDGLNEGENYVEHGICETSDFLTANSQIVCKSANYKNPAICFNNQRKLKL